MATDQQACLLSDVFTLPVILENPVGSMLWLFPPVARQLQFGSISIGPGSVWLRGSVEKDHKIAVLGVRTPRSCGRTLGLLLSSRASSL